MQRSRILKFGKSECTLVYDTENVSDEDLIYKVSHILFYDGYLKPGDRITFGKKGVRINGHGILIHTDEATRTYSVEYVASFRKVTLPKKVTGEPRIKTKQRNEYIIEGDVAYLILSNDSRRVMIDVEDLDKVLTMKWHAHKFWDKVLICNRNKEEGRSWHILTLQKFLGFPNHYHKNGNTFDFRKSNLAPCKKI